MYYFGVPRGDTSNIHTMFSVCTCGKYAQSWQNMNTDPQGTTGLYAPVIMYGGHTNRYENTTNPYKDECQHYTQDCPNCGVRWKASFTTNGTSQNFYSIRIEEGYKNLTIQINRVTRKCIILEN